MSGKRHNTDIKTECQEIWQTHRSVEMACVLMGNISPRIKPDEKPKAKPEPDEKPALKEKKHETYPPIVTIDGRVDTDIDHLIEDLNEDYHGPVVEVPSKYPKPHMFSVIEGSLDDDVDSFANDDGTMEHTLVDAPKTLSAKDLQDVVKNGGKKSPAVSKGDMKKATDRSYNKMYVEASEIETSVNHSRDDGNSYLSRTDSSEELKRAQPQSDRCFGTDHNDCVHKQGRKVEEQSPGVVRRGSFVEVTRQKAHEENELKAQQSFSLNNRIQDCNRGQVKTKVTKSDSINIDSDLFRRYHSERDLESDSLLNSKVVAAVKNETTAYASDESDCCLRVKECKPKDTVSSMYMHAYAESLSCTFTDESFREGHISPDVSVPRADQDHSEFTSETESESYEDCTNVLHLEIPETKYNNGFGCTFDNQFEHALIHLPSYSDESVYRNSEMYPRSTYVTQVSPDFSTLHSVTNIKQNTNHPVIINNCVESSGTAVTSTLNILNSITSYESEKNRSEISKTELDKKCVKMKQCDSSYVNGTIKPNSRDERKPFEDPNLDSNCQADKIKATVTNSQRMSVNSPKHDFNKFRERKVDEQPFPLGITSEHKTKPESPVKCDEEITRKHTQEKKSRQEMKHTQDNKPIPEKKALQEMKPTQEIKPTQELEKKNQQRGHVQITPSTLTSDTGSPTSTKRPMKEDKVKNSRKENPGDIDIPPSPCERGVQVKMEKQREPKTQKIISDNKDLIYNTDKVKSGLKPKGMLESSNMEDKLAAMESDMESLDSESYHLLQQLRIAQTTNRKTTSLLKQAQKIVGQSCQLEERRPCHVTDEHAVKVEKTSQTKDQVLGKLPVSEDKVQMKPVKTSQTKEQDQSKVSVSEDKVQMKLVKTSQTKDQDQSKVSVSEDKVQMKLVKSSQTKHQDQGKLAVSEDKVQIKPVKTSQTKDKNQGKLAVSEDKVQMKPAKTSHDRSPRINNESVGGNRKQCFSRDEGDFMSMEKDVKVPNVDQTDVRCLIQTRDSDLRQIRDKGLNETRDRGLDEAKYKSSPNEDRGLGEVRYKVYQKGDKGLDETRYKGLPEKEDRGFELFRDSDRAQRIVECATQTRKMNLTQTGDVGLVQSLVNSWDKHHQNFHEDKGDRYSTPLSVLARKREHAEKFGGNIEESEITVYSQANQRKVSIRPEYQSDHNNDPQGSEYKQSTHGSSHNREKIVYSRNIKIQHHADLKEKTEQSNKNRMLEQGCEPRKVERSNICYDSPVLTSDSSDTVCDYSKPGAIANKWGGKYSHKDVLEKRAVSVPRKHKNSLGRKHVENTDMSPCKIERKSKQRNEVGGNRSKPRASSIKDSLRAAFKVAEESMTAAAKVAEALNIVMMRANQISPLSSSSLEDNSKIRYRSEFTSAKEATSKYRNNVPALINKSKSQSDQLDTPKQSPKPQHIGQETAVNSRVRDMNEISEYTDRKKYPLQGHSFCQERSSHNTSQSSPARREKFSRVTKTDHTIQQQRKSQTMIPESKWTNSQNSLTLPEYSSHGCGDTSKVNTNSIDKDQSQIVFHVAYTHSPVFVSPQDNFVDKNTLLIQKQKTLDSDPLREEKQVTVQAVKPEDKQKVRAPESRPVINDLVEDSHGLENKDMDQSPTFSGCAQTSKLTLSKDDWTIPNSHCISGRKMDSYFTNIPPVIDQNLQSISLSTKQILRRQMIGSCVDPGHADSSGSDSIEFNSNFNKSIVAKQLHLSLAHIEKQNENILDQFIVNKCSEECALSHGKEQFSLWQKSGSLQHQSESVSSERNVFGGSKKSKRKSMGDPDDESKEMAYHCMTRSHHESCTHLRETVHARDKRGTSYQLHEEEIVQIGDYFKTWSIKQDQPQCVATLCYTDLSSPALSYIDEQSVNEEYCVTDDYNKPSVISNTDKAADFNPLSTVEGCCLDMSMLQQMVSNPKLKTCDKPDSEAIVSPAREQESRVPKPRARKLQMLDVDTFHYPKSAIQSRKFSPIFEETWQEDDADPMPGNFLLCADFLGLSQNTNNSIRYACGDDDDDDAVKDFDSESFCGQSELSDDECSAAAGATPPVGERRVQIIESHWSGSDRCHDNDYRKRDDL